MNSVRVSILRRLLAAAVLAVFVFGALPAQAEPMPVPAAGETRIVPTPQLHYPLHGTLLSHTDVVSWSNVGAKTYVLKLQMGGTDETIKVKVTKAECHQYGYCVWHPSSGGNAFFKRAIDGQAVYWTVMAKFNEDGQKAKAVSETRTFIVDEVVAPTLVSPANNVLLLPGNTLAWETYSDVSKKFVLKLKNTATGETSKFAFAAGAVCSGSVCTVAPHTLPGGLSAATTYHWWVIAKGFTGESAESGIRVFVTP